MSRSALDGYPMDDVDKDFFGSQVIKLSKLYFVEVLGFCCMGNHFHLPVRMRPDAQYSDDELKQRLAFFYDKEPVFFQDGQLPFKKAKEAFQDKRDKIPKPISGLAGIYSLKRLTE